MKRKPFGITRIAIDGWTYSYDNLENTETAKALLRDAFKCADWPSNPSKFTVTPGGFIQAFMPDSYDGGRGWESVDDDFKQLLQHAENEIRRVVDGHLMNMARRRTAYVTLGIDLNFDKHKEERLVANYRSGRKLPRPHTHAELVAILETKTGDIVHWTGKSYPTYGQQHTLIHVTDLNTHCIEIGGERLLILGCHDLNMFINRGKKTKNNSTDKVRRKLETRRISKKFKPTLVMHHPHSTYSTQIWGAPWGACLNLLPSVQDAVSGIAFCGHKTKRGRPSWQQLDAVLSRTSFGDNTTNVCVKGIP